MWVFFHLMLLLFSTNNTLTMQYGPAGRKENTPGEMSTYWVQIQLRLKLLFILLRPINSVAIRTSIDYNLLTRTDKFSGLMPSVENNILYYIITKQTLHTHNGNTSTLARTYIFKLLFEVISRTVGASRKRKLCTKYSSNHAHLQLFTVFWELSTENNKRLD